MHTRLVVIVTIGLAAGGCQQSERLAAPTAPAAVIGAAGATRSDTAAEVLLPFHSEANWQKNMLPPAGRCTQPLPAGLTYLWLTENSGTATSTHLGEGTYANNLCVFGTLTNPDAPPGSNGKPAGWYDEWVVWTAANGDQLRATGRLTGFTAPPGTPGMKFIETLHFVDGGTGRFEFAEGDLTSYVDPTNQTVVYDGTIRYGRKEK